MTRFTSAIMICLLAAGCSTELRESPEGAYRSTLHEFTFDGGGTFQYRAGDRPLRLAGTWTSTLEVEITDDEELDDQTRGHINLVITSIEIDGEAADVARDGSGGVIYRVGDANLGWWVHHPDGALQENEMTIEHNRAGQSRSPFAAGFTAWYANPE
jgi:hypothetical protein